LNEAKVLAVGPGGLDKDGKRVSCSVQAGDKVLIPQVSLLRVWSDAKEEYAMGGKSFQRQKWKQSWSW
jgi:co-chaperonin GroES (HSP10)